MLSPVPSAPTPQKASFFEFSSSTASPVARSCALRSSCWENLAASASAHRLDLDLGPVGPQRAGGVVAEPLGLVGRRRRS